MINVSIIIPVYNSSKYIEKCVISLGNQTYKDFEVIFVDDCSSDDTINVIERIASNVNLNFTILKQELNQGPGSARNKGIENANGQYLIFIDSDDWIKDTYIMKLVSLAEEENADIVFCDYLRAYSNGKLKVSNDFSYATNIINNMEYAATCNDGVTRKIIRKKTFDEYNIKFPIWRNGEDIDVAIKIAIVAKKIIYLAEPMYYYYQRDNSLSNSLPDNDKFYIEIFNNFREYLINNNFNYNNEIIKGRVIVDLLYNQTLLMLKLNNSNKRIKEHLKKVNNQYKGILNNFAFNMYPISKRLFIFLASKNNVLGIKFMFIIKKVLRIEGIK